MAFHNNIIAGASGAGGATDYQISKSLRFNGADTAYLNRTPSSAGNRKTWTWSGWVKRSALGATQGRIFGGGTSDYFDLYFPSGDELRVIWTGGSLTTTTALFRDASAWYHIVLAVDTTQATAGDRIKIYVNGTLQDRSSTNPSQDYETAVNNNVWHSIGRYAGSTSTSYFNGYLADVNFIDGQALAPTEFGEYDNNNVWQPKKFTGTYNTARSFASYPAVTISPSVIGGGNVTHVNGGGTYFYSQAQTGAGSIKVEFSSPITGVTSIKMNGGGYGVGSTYHIKLNGSDVLTNLTTASGWAQVEHTISSTDISSFEIYTTNAGWSLYNLLFNDTSPSGTASLVTPAGVNGFHLDFSDNSSTAALGKNSAVDDDYTPTVGALTTTKANNFYSVGSYPPGNLFDGSTSTFVYGGYDSSSTNSDLVWTPNGSYSASSSLRVHAGYYSTIYVNGVSKATGGQSSAGAWVTLSHTGPITSIKFENTSNANVVLAGAIEVDGTILETTAWTVNNLAVAGSAWDQSQTWSSLGTGTAYNSNYVWTNAFDGDNTSNSATTFPAVSQTMTWTPSSPITVNTSVIVYVYNQTDGSNYGIKVNGSYLSATGAYGAAITRTAAQLSNQLTSIELVTSSGALGPYLAAVEVDGVLLVDSGVADPAAKNIDSLIDTPTNYTADSGNNGGNYCTLNPLNNSGQTLKEGNLECSGTSGRAVGTLFASSGKFYWEFTAGTSYTMAGIESSTGPYGATYSGENNQQYALYGNAGSGQIYHNGGTSSFDGFVSGDIIGVALDMDAGKLYFYKNGSAMNSGAAAATGLTGAWTANCRSGSGSYDGDTVFNFGQRPFTHTPPTGYVSLCTQNLAAPTIADGSTAFDALTYTGSSSPQTVSGLNFASDLLWIKSRSHSGWHILQDSIRGFGKSLFSNSSNAEVGNANDLISNVTATGFSVNTNYDSGTDTATTTTSGSNNYVAWAWDAGSSNTSISVGGLNSSFYNQSQTWSSGTFFNNNGHAFYAGSAANIFDNVENGPGSNGDFALPVNGGTFTLTFSQFSSATTVELQVEGTGNALKINGSFVTIPSGSPATATYSVSGLTTIEWLYNGASNYCYLGSIKVDGIKLLDPSASVTNVPTIASTVRANPSTGVSIINYVGTGSSGNIAHGLNAAPEFFMIKNRELNNYDWWTWHKGIGPNYYVRLNSSNGRAYAGHFFAEAPDSNVIKFEGGVGVTSTNHNHIVYAFAPVEGFSAFGKFSGNSNTDGPFQYCGFKPRFLLLKGITQASRNWIILDTARDSGNVGDSYLHPDSDGAENTYAIADILSNGFKMRYSGGAANQTGEDYIWAAFAEHPFKTARAR